MSDYIYTSSREVLAHDIDFGELAADYLAYEHDTIWRQLWMANGVIFIHKLTTATSYEDKLHLLWDSERPRSPHLTVDSPELLGFFTALWDVYHEPTFPIEPIDSRLTLKVFELSMDELLGLWQPRRAIEPHQEDPDPGPFNAWFNQHKDSQLSSTVSADEDAWLRAHAYVLWDEARLRTEFADGFGEPDLHPLEYTEKEHDEMIESFDLRSQIWQQGGKGYWSKGDHSRIDTQEVHGNKENEAETEHEMTQKDEQGEEIREAQEAQMVQVVQDPQEHQEEDGQAGPEEP
ncbi:hypothetical protein VTJ49DRAFT_4592 [Mycothermus thermophilus]|uniref:Uncharacterized protein n=1 Tax=Humicola insolens TaxID=85995 RepID=A0ABR3V526_HUMIN